LRWFTPHLALAGAFLAMIGAFFFRTTTAILFLALYAAFGLAIAIGCQQFIRGGRLMQIFRGLQYLAAMQAAIFAGFLRFCRGNLEGRWQRSERD
jgi:hypothetical protein